MAVLNSGKIIRFTNGGVMRVYTSATAFDTVALLQQGSLRWSAPGDAPIRVHDGRSLDHIGRGDERPVTGSLSAKATPATLAGTNNLLDAIKNVWAADGSLTTKKVEFRFPDAPGAATGTSVVFNKFFLPEGYDWQAAASNDPDQFNFQFEDFEAGPTITRY